MMVTTKDKERAEDILATVTSVLEENKVMDLEVISVSEKSTLTDYVVIGTGTSTRHLMAMADYVIEALKKKKYPVFSDGMDDDVGSIEIAPTTWIVLDGYDVMVHLFMPEAREHYRLEDMWLDLSRRDEREQEKEDEAEA